MCDMDKELFSLDLNGVIELLYAIIDRPHTKATPHTTNEFHKLMVNVGETNKTMTHGRLYIFDGEENQGGGVPSEYERTNKELEQILTRDKKSQ